MSMTVNMFSQKIYTLFFTIVAMSLAALTQKAENISLIILLPFLFDAGHFLLATIYQKRAKQIDSFFWAKILVTFLIGLGLYFYGNSIFSRWFVYSIGAWHVLNDERFTLRDTNKNFHFLEVFVPVIGYSYLIFLKFFNQVRSTEISCLYGILLIIYLAWLFTQKNKSLWKFYFLFFGVVNLVGLLLYQQLSLLMIVLFYIYFHYVSFYIYYYQKNEDKKSFAQNVLAVNGVIFLIFLMVFLLGQGFSLTAAVAQSFFIPGWLLLHIISTIRRDELAYLIPSLASQQSQ